MSEIEDAVVSGDLRKVKQLLKKRGNANQITSSGDSLLHSAVYNDDLEMVKLLFLNGAQPGDELDVAVRHGFTKIALFLFVRGVWLNINARHGQEKSIVVLPESDCVDLMKLFVACGADLDEILFHNVTKSRDTVLYHAANFNAFCIFELLLPLNISVIHVKRLAYGNCTDYNFLEKYTQHMDKPLAVREELKERAMQAIMVDVGNMLMVNIVLCVIINT